MSEQISPEFWETMGRQYVLAALSNCEDPDWPSTEERLFLHSSMGFTPETMPPWVHLVDAFCGYVSGLGASLTHLGYEHLIDDMIAALAAEDKTNE